MIDFNPLSTSLEIKQNYKKKLSSEENCKMQFVVQYI